MGHLIEQNYTRSLAAKEWLRDAMSPFDVVATLSTALAPAWSVQREIDPSGDLTIIVLPTGDGIGTLGCSGPYEDSGRTPTLGPSGERYGKASAPFRRVNERWPRS